MKIGNNNIKKERDNEFEEIFQDLNNEENEEIENIVDTLFGREEIGEIEDISEEELREIDQLFESEEIKPDDSEEEEEEVITEDSEEEEEEVITEDSEEEEEEVITEDSEEEEEEVITEDSEEEEEEEEVITEDSEEGLEEIETEYIRNKIKKLLDYIKTEKIANCEKEISDLHKLNKQYEKILEFKKGNIHTNKYQLINDKNHLIESIKSQIEREKATDNSRIDLIMKLVYILKYSIEVRNGLMDKMVFELNIKNPNNIQKKGAQYFAKYGYFDISVLDSRFMQYLIIQIQKILTVFTNDFKKNDDNELAFSDNRAISIIRKDLNILYDNINMFDNKLNSNDKPSDIRNLFSKLEPQIASLYHLDKKKVKKLGDFENCVASFNKFKLTERNQFFKTVFEKDSSTLIQYLNNFDEKNIKDTIDKLLGITILDPAQILEQINRLSRDSPLKRQKLIEYFNVEFTDKEKEVIAEDELNRRRN